MNERKIDLRKSQRKILPFSSEQDATNLFIDLGIEKDGWSFSNGYYLEEVRNIYLKLTQDPIDNRTYKQYEKVCKDLPYTEKPWTERKIQEYVNLLKNLNILDKDNHIKRHLFFQSNEKNNLTKGDYLIFKTIYFEYFRFKEIMGWFLNPMKNHAQLDVRERDLVEDSKIIFSYPQYGRFTDSFFFELENEADVFEIKSNDERLKTADAMKRFWDVFCKWGIELNLLQKFNLDYFGIKTIEDKSISCVYFIKTDWQGESLKEFIKRNYKTKYIHIPELVLKLILNFRCSVDEAKLFVVSEYEKDKFSFSLDRTSEIFIKKSNIKLRDTIFHPIYKSSYISHLTVLK